MKTFKPGQIRDPLPEAKVPKWYGAPKDELGRPIDPDHPPDHTNGEGYYNVAPGVAMQKPLQMPNKRGVGGRPTKKEAGDKTPDKGAANAVSAVRETTPPLHSFPPRGKSWEQEYNKAEQEIERQEATALLAARKERLEAISEETLIRQSNRRLCMGFGAVGINAISTMNTAVKEIQRRMSDKELLQDKLSLKDLNQIIATAGSIANKAQQAVESMARAERYILRHPLEDGAPEDDDIAEMTPDDAKVILENLTKSLNSSMKIIKGKPDIVATQEAEDDDGTGS